jgi:putative ABC transport system permease protein
VPILPQNVVARGIRWRLGGSILTVVASAAAFGAAAIAPLYLRSAEDSVNLTTVSSAPFETSGVDLLARTGTTLAQLGSVERSVDALGGEHRWFGRPITTVLTGVTLPGAMPPGYHGALVARSGICQHLVLVSGSCDLTGGGVLVSQRSAAVLGVSVSGTVGVQARGDASTIHLPVAGIYQVPGPGSTYWWGERGGIFDYGALQNHLFTLDPFVASASTVMSLGARNPATLSAQIPLTTRSVGVGDDADLLTLLQTSDSQAQRSGVDETTGLIGLIDGAAHVRHVMSTIVAAAAVQLLLLGLWILGGLVVRNGEVRRGEIRLARLRGYAWLPLAAVVTIEPAILCLIGLVLGVALATAAAVLLRTFWLTTGTAIVFDGWFWVALASGVAGTVLCLAVGALRVLRSTTIEGQPDNGSLRRSRASALWTSSGTTGDLVLLVLSAIALVELGTSGAFSGASSNPLAVVGPGLIALGIAVIAVHVVLTGTRWLVRRTAGSDHVAIFLAVRQIARRPVFLRQARVLVIALCLAYFAAGAWSVAGANRKLTSQFESGAVTVATVRPSAGVDPVAVVDQLDPTGRYAMAVATVHTQSTELLAVDPTRLAAVATWPAAITARSVEADARALTLPWLRVPTVTGQAIGIDADTTGSAVAPTAGEVDLYVWVYSIAESSSFQFDLGPVHAGPFDYQANLESECLTACRFLGLSLVPTATTSPAILDAGISQVTAEGIRSELPSGAWTGSDKDLGGNRWSADQPGVSVSQTGQGPLLHIGAAAIEALSGGVSTSFGPMSGPVPPVLPAVVTTQLEAVNGVGGSNPSIPFQGLDGDTLNARSVAIASTLPQLGSDGLMTNLELLQISQTASTIPGASYQVWLGADAPRDVVAQLDSRGLTVTSIRRSSTIAGVLDHSGPALADDYLVVATVVALLLAGISTLAILMGDSRSRAGEYAALELSGLRRKTLVWSLVGELGALVVTALFGAVAGIIAIRIALPSLPEFATTPSVFPPLDFSLPTALLALVTGCLIAVVALAGWVAGSTILRNADRLVGLRSPK